jgi:hypothetical protein
MATLGSTQVSANSVNLPLPLGPCNVEFWRATYGTVGDTIAITPARGRFVISAISSIPASQLLSTAGTNTNVTFTLTVSGATDVTGDIMLITQI